MRRVNRNVCGTNRSCGLLASAVLFAAVAGCTSSDGGGSLAPSGGQNPDPVVLDFPIAYIKRPVPAADLPASDARELLDFQPGADLYVRDRASPSASDRNVTTEITLGEGDVRDVEPSYDGTRLVFAMREPLIEGADEEDQPTWNIWEYDTTAQQLRRVIQSDIVAEEGHDIAPHYLPDGRIVFTSTRQRQSRAILLDEGKPQFAADDEDRREPAFVLHVMNADGTGLRQISFNQSHDIDPAVLDDGRIVFSRWENAGPNNEINLYTVRPDGSQLELLYGAQSHATGTDGADVHFLEPRPATNGRILVRAQPFEALDLGGELLEIDVANYVEITQPTLPNRGALSGPAQVPATANVVSTIEGPSPGGRYSSAYPLRDGTNRLLVSWTQCRLLEEQRIVPCTEDRLATGTAVSAPPLYGIWMYDPAQRTQLPVVAPTEGVVYTEVVAMQPLPLPAVILDAVAGVDFDADLESEGVGILDIRSVYDFDGADTAPGGLEALADPRQATAAQRPARFLRIEKAVSLPDDDFLDFDNSAFGVTARFGMREILGYAPVEPDGSVRVKVPASVPFAVTVLDGDGRRISPRHENWLQVRAGEELRCNGCHDGGQRRIARSLRAVRSRERRRHDDRAAVPELEPSAVRGFRRDHGADACAHQLPDRLRGAGTVAGHRLRGRLDGSRHRGATSRCRVRLSLCGPRNAGARHPGLPDDVAVRLPRHDPLRGAHPPAVEQGARDACGRRRHGAGRRHLHELSFGPGRRWPVAGASGPAGTDGRAIE